MRYYEVIYEVRPLQVFVSSPGFFQRSCGRTVNQHHSNQYRLRLNATFLSLNICASLRACGIKTTEDAEILEIAKSMQARNIE